jgi:hypothetical protein
VRTSRCYVPPSQTNNKQRQHAAIWLRRISIAASASMALLYFGYLADLFFVPALVAPEKHYQ